jgi:orotate phosphoribosyltransferase
VSVEDAVRRTKAALDAQRDELRRLIVEVAVERRPITLSSGKQSDFYLDLRRVTMRPRGQRLAGELLLALLMKGPWVDAIGGMAVGAVPLVAAVLSAAAHHDPAPRLLGFFVRKEAKKHGLGNRIEGAFAPGQSVALVEDTTTTGASTLDALDAVTEAGGKVTRVLCLVERGEGAAQAFAARGIALEPLFTRQDLGV